jgi:Virus neck protein
MATNVYFNPFPKNITSEQLLVEDLVIEAMQIYGMEVFYLPRSSRDQVDFLYGEDTLKQYTEAYTIEMYLEDVTGMEGDGDFISKFGLEIKDEVTLLISRRRFAATVPQKRPHEGDLVYVPLVQNFFEITFVEHENNQAMYYTLGRGRGANVYVYALKMKQFVFSNEIVNTGVREVDEQIRDAYPRTRITLLSGSGNFVEDEIVYQGANLAYATAQAIVHNTTANSFIDIIRVSGSFLSGNVHGNTSSANWIINTVSDTALMNTAFEDVVDNARIQSESDGILDFTEHNPFGEP